MKSFDRCKTRPMGQYRVAQRMIYLPRREYDLVRRVFAASPDKSAKDFMLRVLTEYCQKAVERMDNANHRKATRRP